MSSKSYFLFALAPRSGLGAAISVAIAHSSLACCNSASAGQSGVAAFKDPRSFGAADTCVILVSFATGRRKPYGSG